MTSSSVIPRKVLIYGLVLPVAAFLGYLLAAPDVGSLMLIGMFVGALLMPLFLRWHHVVLIFTWNLSMTMFFLPGNPPAWMLATAISLSITLLNRILDKETRFLGVPSVTWSLIVFTLVVLFTMKMTGGLGLRVLGSGSYGGRKYVFVLMSVAAFFALSMRRISIKDSGALTKVFFLTGLSPIISTLIYYAPTLWFLYHLFPVDWAIGQATDDFLGPLMKTRIGRLTAFGPLGMAFFSLMLCHYGMRGILDWSKPWRFVLFGLVVVAALLGGFRSILVLFTVTCLIQFYLEGLHRTPVLPAALIAGCLAAVILIPFASKLPLPIQRCLTVLPIKVDTAVRLDAQASTDWRLRMWDVLVPEVPRYFFIGKGCATSATDYNLSMESVRRGLSQDYEVAMLAGDYHNGPLSILIPFSGLAFLAFLWFLVASLRVLLLNHRHGDPALATINAFLFAAFIAKTIYFFVLFGSIHTDLISFTGLVGLSIALNGGVRTPAPATNPRRAKDAGPLSLRPFRA